MMVCGKILSKKGQVFCIMPMVQNTKANLNKICHAGLERKLFQMDLFTKANFNKDYLMAKASLKVQMVLNTMGNGGTTK